MAEDGAPPVVAVVVAFDPGPWLEECLEALTAQDYRNLSVLVLDAGSTEPIAARIAAVAPEMYLRRFNTNRGYGPAANEVLEIVEGTTFYCFCHDDVVLDPDAIRKMVEEAFRSNAGIVAPKLVAYDEPDRLLQLGLGVDRFGAPVRRVARGEFDQSQHDEAREVFGAPGGCSLVRADLFATLGGFDDKITMFGEDVDLSWRARVAGARVVVAPSARVRHCEATASRQRPLPDARALQWRHELRAVLKNYGPSRRALVAVQLAALSVLEIVYFGLIGKRWRVQQVIAAWRWNLAPEQQLHAARLAVAETRRIPDRVVTRLFTRRSLRVTRFIRPMLEELALHWSPPSKTFELGMISEPAPLGTDEIQRSRRTSESRLSRRTTVVLGAVVLVLVIGSRSVLVGHLPLIGQYLPLPGPTSLLARFFGGNTDIGLQRSGPSSPAFLVLGVVGLVLFSGMGLVIKLVLIVSVVLGALGVARLLTPLAPNSARVAGAIAYLFIPLAWNDLGTGDIQALAVYAGMPWLLSRLLRASGLEPFATATPSPFAWRPLAEEALATGVILAVVGAFDPLVVLLMLVSAAAVVLATALFDRPGAGLRSGAVALLASLVAFILDFPWSLTFIQGGARFSALAGASPRAAAAPTLEQLLSFSIGPVGRGIAGLAFIAAAFFVLVAGRGDRFAWGARLWIVALGTLAFAWAASEGWIGSGGGELRAFVAPVAVAIAALVGLGVAAAMADLRRADFGWRQASALAFSVVSVIGLAPVLGSSVGGRWGLPTTGYDSVLSWINSSGATANSERVLWLGDPRAIPSPAWQITPGLAAAISLGGLPDGERVWLDADPSAANAALAAVNDAQSGLTIRLGRLLATDGIRYIVVPSAVAPVLPGTQQAAPARAPQVLLDGLAAQSDLHELPSEGGTVVFENDAWHRGGVVAAVAGDGGTPPLLRTLGVVASLLLWVAVITFFARRRGIGRARRHARSRRLHRMVGDNSESLETANIESTIEPSEPNELDPASAL